MQTNKKYLHVTLHTLYFSPVRKGVSIPRDVLIIIELHLSSLPGMVVRHAGHLWKAANLLFINITCKTNANLHTPGAYKQAHKGTEPRTYTPTRKNYTRKPIKAHADRSRERHVR